MIPHEYIEELTRRTDIVDLVGSYVQLKRKGRLYGGLCPFHSEKTPSFYVYPDTQSFYCFGCGAGGDAITFAKKINSISYGEAVKLLAGRAGMPEPQEDDKTGRMRSRILSMNKEAARFFHACLNSTVEEAYWRRRGLDDKTIVRFGLGYAPNDGQALYQFLRDKGYNQQELDASGLFKRSQSGRIYCLFWKRVMTPIFDLRGNIIAFGGRVLDDSKPKYVNSPETLVYHKSETVFALQIAKKSASRRFVLCEGYMDVISMQQAGIDTAVCACGTALTPEQVRLISEYAEEVILSYDSDEAGQKATLRSLELFRNSPVRVGVLQIPGAKDPDEYIKKYGAERFQALLDGVGNALDFRLKRLRDQYDLKQDAQRLEYVREAVDMLAERSNPTEQEVYAGRLAEETNISKTAIMTQLAAAVKKAGNKRRRDQNRARLHSGEMNRISVPYSAGGSQALGVASAKIEGRLRTPEYVAAAVSACLAGREGRAYDRDLLKNAFSRSGFTSGYLDGKIDGTMFGVRSEADAELTKKTLPALRELYRRERSRVPVRMKLEIEGGGEKLTVTDDEGNRAFAYGDAEPQPARTDPTESLQRSLSKTGGTPFAVEKIDVEMDGGPWFVPGSAVNELRRTALEGLQQKREVLHPWPVNDVTLPPLPLRTLPPHRTLRARFEHWDQVPERALSGIEYLILPIAQADRVPREWRSKTILELPRVMFGALEADTARRIAATQDAGFAGYEAGNIAHLRLCRGLPLSGGFGLNVTNDLSAQFYADHGLDSILILPEVKDSDISTIAPTKNGKPVPTGVLIYGHMPLMVTRACPLQNIHDCTHCDKTGVLTDRKAKKFPVRCGMGVRTIYNPVPIYMGDKPGALTVDYGVAYFTLETREEAAAILDAIRQHAPFEGDFTRGLYFKGTN